METDLKPDSSMQAIMQKPMIGVFLIILTSPNLPMNRDRLSKGGELRSCDLLTSESEVSLLGRFRGVKFMG